MLRVRKSGSVRVTPTTYNLIRRGNAARDTGRWNDAVAAYRDAIATDPDLHHIYIQLGHALKEAGAYDEADAAYVAATRLRAADAEVIIHRAHLARRRGRSRAATALFLEALGSGDWVSEAERELCRTLCLEGAGSRDILFALLLDQDGIGHDPGLASIQDAGRAPSPASRPLVFDITDLVGHFRHQRLPTGIQRVQIEALSAALRVRDAAWTILCCFVSGRSGMVGIPVPLFLSVIAVAEQGGDVSSPEWQHVRARLMLHLALAEHMRMPERAIFINLGTSLWMNDYYLQIRNAKMRHKISYIPFVHDMIPMKVPKFCLAGVRTQFAAWLAGLFQHADGFLTNSRSTAHDLVAAARYLGHDDPADRLEIVPLNAAPPTISDPLPAAALARWGLCDTAYALMVSTIEPRKNHVLAFDGWAELFRRRNLESVPRLVCVGRDGWLNDHVFARLAGDPALIAGVTVIHSVSDAEMELLYRHSAFSIYPSHYEGWGLPITESLCHGKVPVIADNSSLPEAGAGFAELFESGSVPSFVNAVERVAFDPLWRLEREAQIEAEFAPRSWSQVAAQMIGGAERLAGSAGAGLTAPLLRLGVYYPVSLHRAEKIWPDLVSGEIFRIGDGWLWPEGNGDGCRTTAQGGVLQFRMTDTDCKPLRLYLRVRGLNSRSCPLIISTDRQEIRATIGAGEMAWLACDIPADSSSMFHATVRGFSTEEMVVSTGGASGVKPASVAVVGLLLCDASDEAANQRAIANIAGWRAAEVAR